MSNDLHALVRAGLVDNVIVWDGVSGESWEGEEDAPEGWVPFSQAHGDGVSLVPIPTGVLVQIGWAWDGFTFAAPTEPERPAVLPASVSQDQSHLPLVDAGLYAQAFALIEGIEDPTPG